MAGSNLLGTTRQFAARHRFEHQRRNQPLAEQGGFLGLRIHFG
jgi:hypothetical protein